MEAYGYIYEIKFFEYDENNELFEKYFYIGKHKCNKKYKNQIDPTYYGSGKLVKRYIQKHSKENLIISVLKWCYSENELNTSEAQIVTEDLIQNIKCLNLVPGGSGGDYIRFLSKEDKERIRIQQSIRMKELWKDETYRQKFISSILEASQTDEHRKLMSIKLKRYFKEHPEAKEDMRQSLIDWWNLHLEAKIEKSNLMKDKWQDSKYRENQTLKIRESHTTEEFKQKMQIINKQTMSRSDVKKKN